MEAAQRLVGAGLAEQEGGVPAGDAGEADVVAQPGEDRLHAGHGDGRDRVVVRVPVPVGPFRRPEAGEEARSRRSPPGGFVVLHADRDHVGVLAGRDLDVHRRVGRRPVQRHVHVQPLGVQQGGDDLPPGAVELRVDGEHLVAAEGDHAGVGLLDVFGVARARPRDRDVPAGRLDARGPGRQLDLDLLGQGPGEGVDPAGEVHEPGAEIVAEHEQQVDDRHPVDGVLQAGPDDGIDERLDQFPVEPAPLRVTTHALGVVGSAAAEVGVVEPAPHPDDVDQQLGGRRLGPDRQQGSAGEVEEAVGADVVDPPALDESEHVGRVPQFRAHAGVSGEPLELPVLRTEPAGGRVQHETVLLHRAHPATDVIRGLEHRHLEPGLVQPEGRAEPGDPRPHHDDPPWHAPLRTADRSRRASRCAAWQHGRLSPEGAVRTLTADGNDRNGAGGSVRFGARRGDCRGPGPGRGCGTRVEEAGRTTSPVRSEATSLRDGDGDGDGTPVPMPLPVLVPWRVPPRATAWALRRAEQAPERERAVRRQPRPAPTDQAAAPFGRRARPAGRSLRRRLRPGAVPVRHPPPARRPPRRADPALRPPRPTARRAPVSLPISRRS